MAFTVSSILNTVVGDQRLGVVYITPDAVEGVATAAQLSMNNITAVLGVWKVSGTTGVNCCTVKPNVGTTGTVAAGQLAFSSIAGVTSLVIGVSYLGS
jgi:hypothetical protein